MRILQRNKIFVLPTLIGLKVNLKDLTVVFPICADFKRKFVETSILIHGMVSNSVHYLNCKANLIKSYKNLEKE